VDSDVNMSLSGSDDVVAQGQWIDEASAAWTRINLFTALSSRGCQQTARCFALLLFCIAHSHIQFHLPRS
jgi:hypothetical protein